MVQSRQRQWVADFLESAPSLVFLLLWRSEMDLRFAGWIGAGLALAAVVGFRWMRLRANPILLGVNIHLALITPVIDAAFYVGARDLARPLAAAAPHAVFVTIFLVGSALMRSRHGFIGVDGLSTPVKRANSLVLLAVAFAAIIWAFAVAGQPLTTIALPMTILFGARRLLIARAQDRELPPTGGGAFVVAGASFELGGSQA